MFSEIEIENYGITPWKYAKVEEHQISSTEEHLSIWDYKENHLRFRLVLDGKEPVFTPYLPLYVSKVPEITQ